MGPLKRYLTWRFLPRTVMMTAAIYLLYQFAVARQARSRSVLSSLSAQSHLLSPSSLLSPLRTPSLSTAPLQNSLNHSAPGSLNPGDVHYNNSTKKLLCLLFTGRLGNELFEYASTLGLALTLNRTPVFLDSFHVRDVLKDFRQQYSEIEMGRCRNASHSQEETGSKYSDKLTRLDPKHDFMIGLYLQSYKYFQPHIAQVLKALTFTDDIRNESSLVVRQLRQKFNASTTLIGVHIRRGDLAMEYNVKLGYPVASRGYVNRSLAFFRALYPDCAFVVASDSPQWCKDNFPSGFRVHYLDARSPAVHMLILSAMDHTIITFGSFSWWVGFLNRGTTVYMKDFLTNGTFISRSFNPGGADYIYPGWIPL